VNKRYERPPFIAYVGGMAELKRIDETGADWRIGAAVPLDRVMAAVARELPDFAEVLRRFGSAAHPLHRHAGRQHRQRLAHRRQHALPAGAGRHADLRRRGPKGKDETRRVEAGGLLPGQKRNVLQPGEFIEAIEVPRPQGRGSSGRTRSASASSRTSRPPARP
jgi:xanthine dehydrogenase small subunit